MRVLVIEDYEPLRKSIAQGLREAGFAVDVAAEGEEGLWYVQSGEYDVIVLDLMLPKIDGLTIVKRVREQESHVHILILTAKDTLGDRLRGLDLGADDYMIKPFAFEELLARVRALVRRKYSAKSPIIRIGDLLIDTTKKEVRRSGSVVDLTAREYNILEFLAINANRVVTRAMIWERLYDFAAEQNSNVIDVYVANLRKKLKKDHLPQLIYTRRGLGYVLQVPR